MNISKLSREEKLELLNQAKDAYYNTGEEILSDREYDELEKELGLENKNYVGSKQGNYTVKHSFIMGSLEKLHVSDYMDENEITDWDALANAMSKWFKKANNPQYVETTPKLDGNSFRTEFTVRNGKAVLLSCSTRGNGQYGGDISHIFRPKLRTSYWSKINEACANILEPGDILTISGEVIMSTNKFETELKSSGYSNQRGFVAGQLNRKDFDENTSAGKDLSFVCYDYRIVEGDKVYELSWMNPNDKTYKILEPYLNHIGELPDPEYCQVHKLNNGRIDADTLAEIYDSYYNYRKEITDYMLDGIVFKPEASARKENTTRERPEDCLALKFNEMFEQTEITDIIWEAKKSGEYKPIGIVKPVLMDGKVIKRVTLHNYNDILKKGCGIGSIVKIALQGDIIPGIKEVVEPAGTDNLNLPEDSEVVQTRTGAKLMKVYENEEDQYKAKFMNSAEELKINNVGPAAAKKLWDVLHEDIDQLDNILDVMSDDVYSLLYSYLGNARSISNIVESLKQYAQYITVYDIIRSCCIPGCRDKSAKVCEKIILGLPYNTTSINRAAYQWALDVNNPYYIKVMNYIDKFGISIEDEAVDEVENTASNNEKIPIVMTGSPKQFGFKTKAEFLNAHPEFVDVGSSIKDCKILFTDDLNSTSGKMKQAAKYGVEVRLYESFYF